VGRKKSDVFFKYGALKEPVHLDLLFNGNKIGISTAVVKLQKFLGVKGFSKDYTISEDYEMWLRLARKNTQFFYIPDFLSKYVWHEDSESNRVEEMTREKLEIFENNYRLIVNDGKYDKRYLARKYKRGKSILLFGASRKFYFLKDFRMAVEYSILAINSDNKFWKPYIGLLLSYFMTKKFFYLKNKRSEGLK